MSKRTKRELVSQREYARRRGVSQPTVCRAVKDGRLTLVAGKVDPVAADREWPKPPLRVPKDSPDYHRARAQREQYRAELTSLELSKLRGELLPAEDVRRSAFALARQTRDRLMAIPDRVSAALAAASDPEDVRRILDVEIDLVCRELSEGAKP